MFDARGNFLGRQIGAIIYWMPTVSAAVRATISAPTSCHCPTVVAITIAGAGSVISVALNMINKNVRVTSEYKRRFFGERCGTTAS